MSPLPHTPAVGGFVATGSGAAIYEMFFGRNLPSVEERYALSMMRASFNWHRYARKMAAAFPERADHFRREMAKMRVDVRKYAKQVRELREGRS